MDTYTKQEVDDKFNELGHTIKRYGVRRKLGATTAELERIGNAIGLVANADTNLERYNVVINDFDTIYPWSHMKKCIITDTGKVIYVTGTTSFTTTGLAATLVANSSFK